MGKAGERLSRMSGALRLDTALRTVNPCGFFAVGGLEVNEVDASDHHDKYGFDYPEPDPYPDASAAKRRRLEQLDIRAAVTVYKDESE